VRLGSDVEGANTLLGIVVLYAWVSDMSALLANNMAYFHVIYPLRTMAFFGLAAWCYMSTNAQWGNGVNVTLCLVEIAFGYLGYTSVLQQDSRKKMQGEKDRYEEKEN